MAVNVADVMAKCNNYFERSYLDGTFSIVGNVLLGLEDDPACWVYVSGSMRHDGVWEMRDGVLIGVPDDAGDEAFDGRLWFLAPPNGFLSLCKTIAEFDAKNPVGAYVQETFGSYSYVRSQTAGASDWTKAFATQLAPYCRMYTEVV